MQQQKMQAIFNTRMEPIQSYEDYPKYARSETKPGIRARTIIDEGIISDNPCSKCLEQGLDCYRLETKFTRCAYCTAKDRKKEFCHSPGQEAAPAPERRKRRKITGNKYGPGGEYAASVADTTTSSTFVSGTTPILSVVPMSSNTGSLREKAPSAEPTSALTGMFQTQVAPPATAAAEAGSSATLERVTALENQVSGLEAKVMDILVRLDESQGSVSSSSKPQQAVAGSFPTAASDNKIDGLQTRQPSFLATVTTAPVNEAAATRLATKEWVGGPQTPHASSPPVPIAKRKREDEEQETRPPRLEHTIDHEEGYRPVNCGCTGPFS